MTLRYSTDIVIFGGGVAGLWLLNRLRQQGFDAILLESGTLGGGQTIASQGIIHGGLKYALSGTLTGAAAAIADMPQRWRSCLAGEGDIDLSGCRVLSNQYYMWSDSGFRSKLKTFLGSKSLRGRVQPLEQQDYPDIFAASTVAGNLYQLQDFVLDTSSLIKVLSDKQKQSIFSIDANGIQFERDETGQVITVTLEAQGKIVSLNAQRFVFCAGEGNQDLITQADLKTPRCQTRPLHMVYVKKKDLPHNFVHCIGDSFKLTPKLTVTSHVDTDGEVVWYLGGELAEAGVGKSSEAQIDTARALLQQCFPWVDMIDAHWQSFAINRAEANINNDYRPDDAYFLSEDNVVVAWPTKLTLSPSLADKLIEQFSNEALQAGSQVTSSIGSDEMADTLGRPQIASSHWD